MFLRDNFGLELFISNNDLAGISQYDARERYSLYHPNANREAAASLCDSGTGVFRKAPKGGSVLDPPASREISATDRGTRGHVVGGFVVNGGL